MERALIPGGGGESGIQVLRQVERLLGDPAGLLVISSADLLRLMDQRQVQASIDQAVGTKPSTLDSVASTTWFGGSKPKTSAADYLDILPSPETMQWFFSTVKHSRDSYRYGQRRRAIHDFLRSYRIERQVVSLVDRERLLLRGLAAMLADGGLPVGEWIAFFALLVWGDGAGRLIAGGRPDKHLADAEGIFKTLVRIGLPTHVQNLARAAARLSAHKSKTQALARTIADCVSEGARWLDAGDVASSRIYALEPDRTALRIGDLGPGMPLYFRGNESLITFGGPGSGKTQAQVIPNLLANPGSAFVLDVKGELYAATAEVRRARFGPVYRFAPTDEAGRSSCYNPFDGISSEPALAATQCQLLASELVPDNVEARDPYWERKAREYVATFALVVAIEAPAAKRNLGEVSSMLSVPAHFDTLEGAYKRSETRLLVAKLKAMAEVTGLQDFASTATAIESGITSNRLESVFDTARSHLSPITRTPSAMAAMARSDWNPGQLRQEPGTTVYLSLRPGEMQAFAPLVRLIFSQHVTALTQDFTRREGVPPVTFFLDEMPQLGLMPRLSDIIDVGRGAGLRLWMFAQYLGQVRAIYGTKADGLINACAVRCFLQPDLDAARFIAPQLGATRHVFTGERKPLAEDHDLMGRGFADDILALGRGEHPARLGKRYAFDEPVALLPVLMAPEAGRSGAVWRDLRPASRMLVS